MERRFDRVCLTGCNWISGCDAIRWLWRVEESRGCVT